MICPIDIDFVDQRLNLIFKDIYDSINRLQHHKASLNELDLLWLKYSETLDIVHDLHVQVKKLTEIYTQQQLQIDQLKSDINK